MPFSFTYQDILAVFLAASAYGLWKVHQWWRYAFRSPLRNLPGPPSASFIYGNMKEVFEVEDHSRPDEWFARYGKHFVDNGLLMEPRLWTLDARALNHILAHDEDYGRPEMTSKTLGELLGRGTQPPSQSRSDPFTQSLPTRSSRTGVLLVEGEEHRQQRRIMNPAFGPAQIRDLTEIFLQKADELARVWSRATQDGPARVNVHADLGKTTLDVIGLAGFGYDFHALNVEGKPNELNVAFRTFFANAAGPLSLGSYLRSRLSILKLIPNARAKRVEDSSRTVRRIGNELVQARKAALLQEMQEKNIDDLQRQDLQGRDLLTLLIRANMAKDVPDYQRLSDEDVVGHSDVSTRRPRDDKYLDYMGTLRPQQEP
ncbi:hypothetical protein NUW54_g6359 [Trametes sanguinea]|uniref:Uncharacterized protein n=1 Tax=Trametes sanguinea TaxID=158606 RepID=A0ACC1PUK7_9APHY|nr:hypothetical protein NUW54_g6359 [Trametes sanguinea]